MITDETPSPSAERMSAGKLLLVMRDVPVNPANAPNT